MLQNVLHLALARRLCADGGVTEHAVVERLLGLACLFSRVVLAEGDSVIQVQVEMLKRAVLHTESAQGRAVDLGCEVL